METSVKHASKVEATKENVELAFNKIKLYADEKGYRFNETVKKSELKFDSGKQKKVCSNYLSRIERKIGMGVANQFLHFLYKKIYKESTPYVQYSEREEKIRESRKAWKKSLMETEKLLATYKETKGDFFKK